MTRAVVLVKMLNGQKVWLRGGVRGGREADPARGVTGLPGVSYDYLTEDEARAHIEGNECEVLEVRTVA